MKLYVLSTVSLGLLMTLACNSGPATQKTATVKDKSSTSNIEQGAAEGLEPQYFRLAEEAQEEVLGGKILSRKALRKSLMEAADKNGDGMLDAEEKAAFKLKLEEGKAEIKAQIVKKFDTNADGQLDKEELKAGFEKLRMEFMTEFADLRQAMRAAHQEAAKNIAAACGQDPEVFGQKQPPMPKDSIAVFRLGDSSDQMVNDPKIAAEADADVEIEEQLDACQKVVQEEKDKMRATFAEKFMALKESMQELRGLMGNLGSCRDKLEKDELEDKKAEKEKSPADAAKDEKVNIPSTL